MISLATRPRFDGSLQHNSHANVEKMVDFRPIRSYIMPCRSLHGHGDVDQLRREHRISPFAVNGSLTPSSGRLAECSCSTYTSLPHFDIKTLWSTFKLGFNSSVFLRDRQHKGFRYLPCTRDGAPLPPFTTRGTYNNTRHKVQVFWR
jgi:hypothetical protein